MGSFTNILTLQPQIPSTGPLSSQGGASSIIGSVIGASDWRQAIVILAEQIQALQDQSDVWGATFKKAVQVLNLALPFPIVLDLSISSNTPNAGNVSWSPNTILYNGQFYGIRAGNTSAGEKLIWWVVGAGSYSFGNSFTPNTTTYLIATNTGGTADVAWNKLGANSIQQANVLGGLLFGYQVQQPATASITGAGTVTVLSYTGAGGLLSFGFDKGNLTGYATIAFTVSVDGQPAQTYHVTNEEWIGTAAAGINTNVQISYFNVAFTSSLVVTVVTTGAGFTGVASAIIGWATKI